MTDVYHTLYYSYTTCSPYFPNTTPLAIIQFSVSVPYHPPIPILLHPAPSSCCSPSPNNMIVLPAIPIIASITAGAWFFRRIFRFITGDCDLRTLTAHIHPTTFRSKVVWITGASSGIGAALARLLAPQGACIILSARREDVLNKLADSLPCPRHLIHVLPLDLHSEPEHIELVASTVSAIFGRLDYVFNNAGVSTRVTAEDFEIDHLKRLFDINFFSAVALSRACLPALRETPGGGGTIINTVSISTIVNTPLRSPYASSKAAMATYFRCLHLEEASVRVVNIFPGSVRTPIAINALMAGGKTFGRTDDNIEKGLDPIRVADRMLAAVSSGITDSWIARPKELMATRLANYFPSLWAIIASRRADIYRRNIMHPA